jgi:hypothetical protein
VLTHAARPLSLRCTEKRLTEPERESLLAHAPRPVKQDAAGEPASLGSVAKPLAECFVSEEGNDRHPVKVGLRPA